MSRLMGLNDFDCIAFDMDGTLAVSKGAITAGMATCLTRLLLLKKVAVISGGRWEQFEKQLIPFIHQANLSNLYILPTSGTSLYTYTNAQWQNIYTNNIPALQRRHIQEELKRALALVGYHEGEVYGEIIQDRLTQITFSGLGNDAPIEKKSSWDPDQKKRTLIKSVLQPRLLDYTITIGGTTSIDITPKGVDKAYGIKKLQDITNIPYSHILFVGDKLEPGGNDYPATTLPIQTLAVKDEKETEQILSSCFN